MTNPNSPSPYAAPPAPEPVARKSRFSGLAWAALILGIVGLVGSPVIIFNNLTAIAAGVGVILGVIAIFGTRKILAVCGVVLSVGAIVVTVVVQQNAIEELDKALNNAQGTTSAPGLPESQGAEAAVDDSGPATNERDHIPMKLGDEAWTGPADDENGPSGTTFAIDKIDVDPSCGEYGLPPDSGHTLQLHVRVATGTDRAFAENAAFVLNPYNFVEIGSDGVTSPAQLGACSDPTKALPTNFGVNQKYSGIIEIVVPEASRTIALAPGAALDGPAGWEWTY